jgi:hypothetical protein
MNRTTTTANSTDRTPALVATPRPKAISRVGNVTRRLLNILMRSLAAPHV